MSILATLKEIAAEAKIDVRVVGRILREASLPEHSGRRFVKADALSILARDADPALLAGHATSARGSGMSSATASLATAKAASEELRGRKIALDLAIREGRYLRRDRVEETVRDMVVRARDALLTLGPKLAPKLVKLDDPHRVTAIVEVEVRAILANLADPMRLVDEALA